MQAREFEQLGAIVPSIHRNMYIIGLYLLTSINPTQTMIPSDSPVLSERQGNLAIVTLNRPDRLNALSGPVMEALHSALHEAAGDYRVRCVLLKAAGRGFCAGGDIKAGGISKDAAAVMSLEDRSHLLRRQMESSALMHTMHKPTVTALRGAVMGAGVGLALSGDFRVASTTLKLETAFRNLGFSGDFGGAYFLTRLGGVSIARDLMMRSRRIDGVEALRLGLVSELVDDDKLDEHALALAHELANGPSIALQYMKRALNASADGASIFQVLDMEAGAMVRTSKTDDHKEAVRAFLAKGTPEFKGH
jgi:2-(1,2-epoxy-1,2-dihydrophenyl)acetyl-CoA isomerase